MKSKQKNSYFPVQSAIWILFILFFPGCERSEKSPANGPVEITLLCGASIRPPLDGSDLDDEPGLLERFHDTVPGVRVKTMYGASNLLLGQLKVDGTGDLFLPGDDFYIHEAAKEGLVSETRTVALFVPVIMVQKDNPLGLEGVPDLAAPDVRLALADGRAAAIGRITREIFHKNGVPFDSLDNIGFTGVTGPKVAQAVALGHADAAIIWRPVAEQYHRHSTVVNIVPEKNVISPLVIAVVDGSQNREKALKFAEFVSGPEGRAVFKKYNYDLK